ncbi:nucleotidyltransferase [Candidatus Desantisbacteria bacterium CG_4_10_14_3_um_filter_40_18]|uniref:Nucleotidyltransferase n=1 Tax=Candidatus Desantisbacteria bacterium CG_4_10_14_3_um_filter_40_18 TaxID=1974544 RepID=A0A2M7P3W9_9BACT|nr:MAG: nucleotidyltransferase [Candidatus Desantisbacteria bacterium CG_4_10_14_3_um_filter_40_18]
MNNDVRWKQRFQNFTNAYGVFCKTLNYYEAEPDDEIVQMALIQAFEFTYELAWNVMKDYLENEGFDEVKNAKQTIRTAFQAELISDAEDWMDMIQRRNLASHTYNRAISEEITKYIKDDFFPLVRKLYEDLKKRL